MKKRLFSGFVILLLSFLLVSAVQAQSNYSFQLTNEIVNVYLNKDGTMSLDYQLTFKNDPGAHPIDFVDLGLPNSDYDINSITADVNGAPVKVSSDYQGSGSGVALELGSRQIRSTGTVHAVVGRIDRIFYPDTSDENYASSEFATTYFDPNFVHGSTAVQVIFHLPPGVQPEEPRYHPASGDWSGSSAPKASFDSDMRITYTWQTAQGNGHTAYKFGASFPKKYIPDSAIVTSSGLDSFLSLFDNASFLIPFCCFALFLLIPVASIFQDRKRRLQYIKPTIAIEGHGIKRGLTAVEAGILMGLPLDRVMTMILFGAVKKGAVQVLKKDPLQVQLLDPAPDNLQPYETQFAQAMVMPDAQRRKSLQEMTVNLVKSVTEKMKGFSRKETIEYYKAINEKAWQQIEAAGTPEVKSQLFEETLEWSMLDQDYDDRSRRTFTGPIFIPTWWHRYDPIYRAPSMNIPTAGTSNIPSSNNSGRVSLPGADLAASVVGGVQGFSGRVLGNINDFTSSVTRVTNPVPKSSSSGGSYRGGSGGCACACACAGCACACAGGGR